MRCPVCQESIAPFFVLGVDITRRIGFAAVVLGAGAALDLLCRFGSITGSQGAVTLGIAALGRLTVILLGFWQLAMHSHHRSSSRMWQVLVRGLMIFALFMMGIWASDLTAALLGPTE